jgi:hypothetical protein
MYYGNDSYNYYIQLDPDDGTNINKYFFYSINTENFDLIYTSGWQLFFDMLESHYIYDGNNTITGWFGPTPINLK